MFQKEISHKKSRNKKYSRSYHENDNSSDFLSTAGSPQNEGESSPKKFLILTTYIHIF